MMFQPPPAPHGGRSAFDLSQAVERMAAKARTAGRPRGLSREEMEVRTRLQLQFHLKTLEILHREATAASLPPPPPVVQPAPAPQPWATPSNRPAIPQENAVQSLFDELQQVADSINLRKLLQRCSQRPQDWSPLNVLRGFERMRVLLPEAYDREGQDLAARAVVLLEEALKGIASPPPMEYVYPPELSNPTLGMHRLPFHPRTAALLLESISGISCFTRLADKVLVFLGRWFQCAVGHVHLDAQDFLVVVWAFGSKGQVQADTHLVSMLASAFVASIGGLKTAGDKGYTARLLSKAIWALTQLGIQGSNWSCGEKDWPPSFPLQARPTQPAHWARQVLMTATHSALRLVQGGGAGRQIEGQREPGCIDSKDIGVLVWCFSRLGTWDDGCPFLAEALAKFSDPGELLRTGLSDAISIAEAFSVFEVASQTDSEKPQGLSAGLQRLLRLLCDKVAQEAYQTPPVLFVRLLKVAVSVRVSHESLWLAALRACTNRMRPLPDGPAPWSVDEVTQVMTAATAMTLSRARWRYPRRGTDPVPCIELSNSQQSEEKLVATLNSFMKALVAYLGPKDKESKERPRIMNVTQAALVAQGLGELADAFPPLRRKMRGVGIREHLAHPLKRETSPLSGPVVAELAMGLAKMAFELLSAESLIDNMAATLEEAAASGGSQINATLVLWAAGNHATYMGRRPLCGSQGGVPRFATAARSYIDAVGSAALDGLRVDGSQVGPSSRSSGSRAPAERLRPKVGDVVAVLFAALALAQTEGCISLRLSKTLNLLAGELARPGANGLSLIRDCTPPELADLVWALGRLGLTAGPGLRDAISKICAVEADDWVADLVRGATFPGRLMWGAVVLCSDSPPAELLAAGRRFVERMPTLTKARPDPDNLVSLLWALATLDLLSPDAVASALFEGFGKMQSGEPQATPTPCAPPKGTWEWALLRELLLYAAPRPFAWPDSWPSWAKKGWMEQWQVDGELLSAAGLNQGVKDALQVALGGRAAGVELDAEVELNSSPSSHPVLEKVPRVVTVRACVRPRRVIVEVLQGDSLATDAGGPLGTAALRLGRGHALKLKLLVQHGWTVFCVQADELLRAAASGSCAALLERCPRLALPVPIPMEESLPENAERERHRPSQAAKKSVSEQAPSGTPEEALAPNTASPPEVPQPASDLVLVELSHGSKKKKLQLRGAMTIAQLIEHYGKVVKGNGNVIVTDPEGVEHSQDLTVALILAEAQQAGHTPPLRLELRLDDW